MTKEGVKAPNFYGSLTQASTLRVGNYEGEEVYVPFKGLVPMVEPNDIVFGGWDISGMNMADAMERAKVLDWELQQQLVPYMKDMTPLPGTSSPLCSPFGVWGSGFALHECGTTHAACAHRGERSEA
eukprot:364033-Chlamydomonas_euryale.AAC.5